MASNDISEERQQLQEKYSTKDNHIYLSKDQVEKWVDDIVRSSTPVQYLLESLQRGGCGVGRGFFTVNKCAAETGGGFSTRDGVILCYNKLKTRKEVELAMTHELIHAYDFCRAADMDLTNCCHHACTEIRAANLSGDCGFLQEFLRGNISNAFDGQHKRCVKRRALMSVAMNPYCSGGKADAAVAEMFPKCFKDTDPFPNIP